MLEGPVERERSAWTMAQGPTGHWGLPAVSLSLSAAVNCCFAVSLSKDQSVRCRTPRSRGQKLRSKSSFLPSSWLLVDHPPWSRPRGASGSGVDRSGLEVLVHLLLGDQSVLELLPQPVAQVVVLGFGHLGLALVETHGRQRLIFRFETAKQQFTAAETAKPKAPSNCSTCRSDCSQ